MLVLCQKLHIWALHRQNFHGVRPRPFGDPVVSKVLGPPCTVPYVTDVPVALPNTTDPGCRCLSLRHSSPWIWTVIHRVSPCTARVIVLPYRSEFVNFAEKCREFD